MIRDFDIDDDAHCANERAVLLFQFGQHPEWWLRQLSESNIIEPTAATELRRREALDA